MHGQQEGQLPHVKLFLESCISTFAMCFNLLFIDSLLVCNMLSRVVVAPGHPAVPSFTISSNGSRANQTHKSHPMGQLKVQVKVKVNVKIKIHFVANANGQVQVQVKG